MVVSPASVAVTCLENSASSPIISYQLCGEAWMKNKIYTLIISCLLMSACTESLVTPAVDEQHATLVSLSPTALLPTAVLATPTETPFLLATSVPRHKDAISSQNIEQVSLLSRLGKGMVEDIAYAPDGK